MFGRRRRRFPVALIIAGIAIAIAVAVAAHRSRCHRQHRAVSSAVAVSATGVARPAALAFEEIPGRIVVDFVDGTTKAEFDEFEKQWGIDLELADVEEGKDSAITVGGFSGSEEEEERLLVRIREFGKVEAAEPMMQYRASFVPNDPDFARQWNMRLIHMPEAWERSRGKGVIVAVLDTGVTKVTDLKGTDFRQGYNFVADNKDTSDDNGHGTHVAGTIAQTTHNKVGVAGVAFESTLMPVKVLDHFGAGNNAAIADGIRWAADHGAKVLNLSLGGSLPSEVIARAVAYARGKGALVVCAAGNTGRGRVEYPAAFPGALAVGAVGPQGSRAPYSSYGKELDLVAPGGDKRNGPEGGITQATIDGEGDTYTSLQGTSMAAPHVSGVAALLIAAGAKTPEAVENALFAGAAAPPAGVNVDEYGHGLLDADKSLVALKAEQALAVAPVPSATPLREWRPAAWALGLLAFVLLSLKRTERPGLLNVLAHPAFLVPMGLSAVGLYFLTDFLAQVGPAGAQAIALPIPEWLSEIIFGRGRLANPIAYSAAPVALVALIAAFWKPLRPVAGGIAIGFAGILAYSAWAMAPALAWLPFNFLAFPWLAANALVCLLLARALIRKEAT